MSQIFFGRWCVTKFRVGFATQTAVRPEVRSLGKDYMAAF